LSVFRGVLSGFKEKLGLLHESKLE